MKIRASLFEDVEKWTYYKRNIFDEIVYKQYKWMALLSSIKLKKDWYRARNSFLLPSRPIRPQIVGLIITKLSRYNLVQMKFKTCICFWPWNWREEDNTTCSPLLSFTKIFEKNTKYKQMNSFSTSESQGKGCRGHGPRARTVGLVLRWDFFPHYYWIERVMFNLMFVT